MEVASDFDFLRTHCVPYARSQKMGPSRFSTIS